MFVSLGYGGAVVVDRGWMRSDDELSVDAATDRSDDDDRTGPGAEPPSPDGAGDPPPAASAPDEEDGLRPLPERLVTELTAHRTLALRDALAGDPQVALLAVLHALAVKAFYRFSSSSCLEIDAKSTGFATQAPGLNDTSSAKAMTARHQAWAEQMPQAADALWDSLVGFDHDSRQALFAYCAAITVNGVQEAWNRSPGRLAQADRLAEALGLDMAEAGWAPTAESYLGRVTKARILEAVREAKGPAAVQLIDHLKKTDMASEAERLLAGTGWLPEVLRTPGLDAPSLPFAAVPDGTDAVPDDEGLPAFLTAVDDEVGALEHLIAAE